MDPPTHTQQKPSISTVIYRSHINCPETSLRVKQFDHGESCGNFVCSLCPIVYQ